MPKSSTALVAMTAAVIALSAAAMSPAQARDGELFDRNRYQSQQGQTIQQSTAPKATQIEQRAGNSAVATDATLAGRPDNFSIKRRKWTPQ